MPDFQQVHYLDLAQHALLLSWVFPLYPGYSTNSNKSYKYKFHPVIKEPPVYS